jgi:hypothetical protein
MEAAILTRLSTTPPLFPFNGMVVLLVMAGVVLVGAAVHLIRRRLRERQEDSRELPPLVYPAGRRLVQPPGLERSADVRPLGELVTYNSSASIRIDEEPIPVSEYAAPPAVHSEGRKTGQGEAAAAVDSDSTLQLLPGRLEPANAGMGQEIRFVRVPGTNRFTFGRNGGPAHTHIQLQSATASRMHAYMVFEAGRWQVGNMSQTNHVVVNGSPLRSDAPRLLEDGDQLEFGELTFVFRKR